MSGVEVINGVEAVSHLTMRHKYVGFENPLTGVLDLSSETYSGLPETNARGHGRSRLGIESPCLPLLSRGGAEQGIE